MVHVGVAWYTEQEWAKVRAAAVDPELLEASYAQWAQMAEQSLAELRSGGVVVEKSYITADNLLAWCVAHNKPNNSASRAEFVSQQERSRNEPSA
jgi:hypothetical protein